MMGLLQGSRSRAALDRDMADTETNAGTKRQGWANAGKGSLPDKEGGAKLEAGKKRGKDSSRAKERDFAARADYPLPVRDGADGKVVKLTHNYQAHVQGPMDEEVA